MPSLVSTSVNYIKATPERLFWSFALTHLVLWTLTPSIFSPNLPLDTIEGYAWGHEWLMGTHKHPPLQAWILESLYVLTGKGRWAPYLASQIAVITAFWAVWKTGRLIAGETEALIGTMLLEGIAYYNFTSPEFNPNVLQLPCWALAGWSFLRAMKSGRSWDWVFFGFIAGTGLYAKYSTGLLLIVLVVTMFAHRDGRYYLRTPGPYLAVLTSCLVFLPHFLWLLNNHFIPLEYATGRMERNTDHYSIAITTSLLVAGQFLALLFALLLAIVLYDRRRAPSRAPAASFDRIFVTFTAFGPFLITFFMSLFLGYHIRDMWETPFWNFIGLWIVVLLRPSLLPNDLRRFAMVWGVVFMMGLAFFIANETLSPYVAFKPKRTLYPGKKLSQTIADAWHEKYKTPLQFVAGDVWPAGNIAWYANDRPHVLMDGDYSISPWIDQIEMKKAGSVLVWCISCSKRKDIDPTPEDMLNRFPDAQIQQPLTLKRMTFADVPPVVIGWAIVPPQP